MSSKVEERLASLEISLHKLTKQNDDKEKKAEDSWSKAVKIFRATVLLCLVALSVYYTVQLTLDWQKFGKNEGSQLTLEDADSLEMPTAGMIPAPYANDPNCFFPTLGSCTAYYDSDNEDGQKSMDCKQWMKNVTGGIRKGGADQTIWSIDGTQATKFGFVYTSILDYVEYNFEFPVACSEPYLWVYLTADQGIVTKANLDPTLSMRDFAQTSFLVQGGQYVMVAFNIKQDVKLDMTIMNTTSISVSSMMIDQFPRNKMKQNASRVATVVYRAGSLKILTNTAQPGQTVVELISIIGGWIGMFLGLSFISLIDMVDELYRQYEERVEKKQDVKAKMRLVKTVAIMNSHPAKGPFVKVEDTADGDAQTPIAGAELDDMRNS